VIYPSRIIDLHTHLFNARYVPLASVIAHAMRRDSSVLADRAAALLSELAGSSYKSDDLVPIPTDPEAREAYMLDRIWAIARFELETEEEEFVDLGGEGDGDERESDAPDARLIMEHIVALSEVDYAAEGWDGEVPPRLPEQAEPAGLTTPLALDGALVWAGKVLRTALRIVSKLMEPGVWGHAENYLEFFLTMLESEQGLLDKLFEGYGDGLPRLQVVHFMMDMQLAYKFEKSPRYPFYPRQLEKMKKLEAASEGRVAGFSAFDPRRKDWEKQARYALDNGFVGFKFYPAMGYLPSGDRNYQPTIDAFFDFCVKNDAPVFTHCTPVGFQTRERLGWNAHPKHWRKVLDNPRWQNLRLCFGHAGGGDASNGKRHSFGWMAKTKGEWDNPDNFASVIAELCVSKPHVYCELGYITELFNSGARERFVNNFALACATQGTYRFIDKVAYGTDWHMPDMVGNVRAYLDFFVQLMGDYSIEEREGFFSKNALQFAPKLVDRFG
jgi:predicted TIM-barrel fold metal-dependent hydrolase